MRRWRVKVAAVAVLASGLGLAVGTAALATRTVKIASHVTVQSKALIFTGTVTASRAACKKQRKVKLYRTTKSPTIAFNQ